MGVEARQLGIIAYRLRCIWWFWRRRWEKRGETPKPVGTVAPEAPRACGVLLVNIYYTYIVTYKGICILSACVCACAHKIYGRSTFSNNIVIVLSVPGMHYTMIRFVYVNVNRVCTVCILQCRVQKCTIYDFSTYNTRLYYI